MTDSAFGIRHSAFEWRTRAVCSRRDSSECRMPNAECRIRSGFTLLEILLSIALLLLLFSMAAFNALGWWQANHLEEGKMRVETLVRMCRGEACNLGKRLELAPTEDGQLAVLVEADPLGKPGQFAPLQAVWAKDLPNDLVRVVRSELIGSATWRLMEGKDEQKTDKPMQAVTFFPDGTVDSAEIELRPTHHDGQHALVTVNGLTNEITSKIFAPLTLEEQAHEEQAKDSTNADTGTPPPPPCPGEP